MSLGIGRNTVNHYSQKIKTCGHSPAELLKRTEQELQQLLSGAPMPPPNYVKVLRDLFPYYERELQKPGVTRKLLWQEYLLGHPEGISYARFCEHYRNWKAGRSVSMHMEHTLGDKLFIDFTGKKLHLVNADSGELTAVEVFVAVLGASQYTYVEAVQSQSLTDFIEVLHNALVYFGGVPQAIVPDNLKAAVRKSSRYEPLLNETFADFATHYQTTILPTRAYRPKDKSLVEGAVKLVYQRIFAPLRHQHFFHLQELNQGIKLKLELYNRAPFSSREYSRSQFFQEQERGYLTPLPTSKYIIKRFSLGKVHKNSHVWLSEDKHYYSVPYQYIGEKVKLAYTHKIVEIYREYERITIHTREKSKYGYTTDRAHLPSTHRYVAEWHPERFIGWAKKIGACTALVVEHILDHRPHPEQAYKACMGILSLAKKVGHERLESACKRAYHFDNYSYRAINNILQKGLEGVPYETGQIEDVPTNIDHQNLRGKKYYR
jgi:transposase